LIELAELGKLGLDFSGIDTFLLILAISSFSSLMKFVVGKFASFRF
jgi:hypothetical protein